MFVLFFIGRCILVIFVDLVILGLVIINLVLFFLVFIILFVIIGCEFVLLYLNINKIFVFFIFGIELDIVLLFNE